MAEESKSIALVILGIVAVIAIVGLVLLFTGARKGATGEYFFGVKEYGGALKGSVDPYARAFAGKAGEMEYGEPWQNKYMAETKVGAAIQTYGDYQGPTKVGQAFSYGRTFAQTPSALTSCYGLGQVLSRDANAQMAALGHFIMNERNTPANMNQYFQQYGPEKCLKLTQLPAVFGEIITKDNPGYALYTGLANDMTQTGDYACCEPGQLI